MTIKAMPRSLFLLPVFGTVKVAVAIGGSVGGGAVTEGSVGVSSGGTSVGVLVGCC